MVMQGGVYDVVTPVVVLVLDSSGGCVTAVVEIFEVDVPVLDVTEGVVIFVEGAGLLSVEVILVVVVGTLVQPVVDGEKDGTGAVVSGVVARLVVTTVVAVVVLVTIVSGVTEGTELGVNVVCGGMLDRGTLG